VVGEEEPELVVEEEVEAVEAGEIASRFK